MDLRLVVEWTSQHNNKIVNKADLPFALLQPGSSPRNVFILIHGLGESPKGMRSLSEFFYSQGNHVLTLCLDGHGTRPEDLGSVTLEQWRKNLADALTLGRHIGSEIVLCGFSLGASLALDLYLSQPKSFAGLFFYSPVFRPSSSLAELLKKKINSPENAILTSVQAQATRTPFQYPYIAANAWKQYVRLCEELASKLCIPNHPPPVTVIVSQSDWLIDWHFLDHFNRMYSADCYLHSLDLQMGHSDPVRRLDQFHEVQTMLYQNFMRRLRSQARAATAIG